MDDTIFPVVADKAGPGLVGSVVPANSEFRVSVTVAEFNTCRRRVADVAIIVSPPVEKHSRARFDTAPESLCGPKQSRKAV
jgi:hypothetical protein